MKPTIPLALAALAMPLAALAQVSHSQARIAGQGPLTYSEIAACNARYDALAQRKADIDDWHAELDAERRAIDDEAARLADEHARLDRTDAAAVADYNARSAEHNRRAAAYNGRAAEMNSAASLLNGQTADAMAWCNARGYTLRDRDWVYRAYR